MKRTQYFTVVFCDEEGNHQETFKHINTLTMRQTLFNLARMTRTAEKKDWYAVVHPEEF